MALITCPDCASEISSSALACPKCGCPVTYEMTIPGHHVRHSDQLRRQPSETMGTMMLVTPWLAVLLIFFWIGNMTLFQGPGSSLALVAVATVGLTAIFASIEASSVGMRRDYRKGTYGPAAWFFLVALMWVIGYPAYLLKRRAYGLTNHFALGLLTAVVFIGSVYLMQASIDTTIDGVRHNLESMQHALGD